MRAIGISTPITPVELTSVCSLVTPRWAADVGHLFGIDHALIANGGVGTAAVYYDSVNLLIGAYALSIKSDSGRDNAVLRERSGDCTGLL